ncbi:MAG: phosphoglycerate dehydrogenase [Patescibacteria group bacterium]
MVVAHKSKSKKALLLENIDKIAIDKLSAAGFEVDARPYAMSEEDLTAELGKGFSLLGIRSKTKITEKSLSKASALTCIGAFCIGVNQIDQNACTKRGIAAFNAPYSNTRSVVEIVMGQIIMLMRKATAKHMLLQKGIWDKSANGCYEVRGKTLGIVGYGNIGSQLSVVAESFGMKVQYFDIAEKLTLGNATKLNTLQELLVSSDIVTLHVDGRKSNQNLISEKQLSQMKKGSYLINYSRGNVVDLDDLALYIQKEHIAGAALDVFPNEPKSTGELFLSPLRTFPNVLLTPHIGGSTKEAQKNIGEFVAERFLQYLSKGDTTLSVNFPNIRLEKPIGASTRIVHIHKNVPGMLAEINKIFAKRKINILGQALGTNNEIGYAVVDIGGKISDKVFDEVKNIRNTIIARRVGL